MKKLIYLLSLVFLIPLASIGQSIELTPFVGYQFGGKMKFIQGDFKIENNLNYGIALDIPVRYGSYVDIYWSHMETKASWNPFSQYAPEYPEVDDIGMSVDYFQIGGMQQADLGTGIVKGFGVLTIGAAYFNAKDSDIQDVWRFAMTLGGGLKIHPTDRIGIRLQGRLLMPMAFGGTGAYCGIGTGGAGCGLGVSGYSMLVQGDFTAGLIIMIGD